MAVAGTRALEQLHAAGCDLLSPDPERARGAEAFEQLLNGCDAVLAAVEPYTARLLAAPAAANLKIISRWGVGYDSVDLAAATRAGIVVTNTPRLLDEAVADYTFALLLALARRIPEGQQTVVAGRWTQSWGTDVADKTLGLIGCGRIGQAVARRAKGFNLRLLAHDPISAASGGDPDIQFVSLERLLAEADFVSLHAALSPESRGLIGEAQLRRMKPTALFINAARGPLVDEAALARALREGWIAGAALDVFCTEPLPPEHPLRGAPNLLLTPHQASFARDTGARVSETAARAIIDASRGIKPQFVVNQEVLAAANCRIQFHV